MGLALPGVAAIATVADRDLPAVLVELAALQAAVLARLVRSEPSTDPVDTLLSLEEAAARLGVAPNWLRRRPGLPFVVKLSEATVRYSAAGVARFIAAHRVDS
jgi:hypothetical protein